MPAPNAGLHMDHLHDHDACSALCSKSLKWCPSQALLKWYTPAAVSHIIPDAFCCCVRFRLQHSAVHPAQQLMGIHVGFWTEAPGKEWILCVCVRGAC